MGSLLFLVLFVSLSSQAARIEISSFQVPESESALHYWTPERLASAKPKESVSKFSFSSSTVVGPDGPEVAIEGSKGNNNTLTGPVDGSRYPYTTVGRLYFTQAGTNWWATASSIHSNTIIASGNSLFDSGAWSTNVVYYPGYPSYSSSFAVLYLYAYTGWTQSALPQYNYGMAATSVTGAFNSVGWAGLKWNVPIVSGLLWNQVGYVNGVTAMFQQYGSIVLPQPVSVTGTVTISNSADMTLGNTWWNETNPNFYANGITVYTVSGHPTVRYSPYFDTLVGDLFYYVSGQHP